MSVYLSVSMSVYLSIHDETPVKELQTQFFIDLIVVNKMYSILFYLPPVHLNLNATSIGIDIHDGKLDKRLSMRCKATYHTSYTAVYQKWQVRLSV